MHKIPGETGPTRYPPCRFHKQQCFMDTNRIRPSWRKAFPLAIWLVFSVSPAWSNVRLLSPSAENAKKVCYCGCDSNAGTAMCTEMCDLAKYKGHWWAKSCGSNQQKARIMAPLPSHTTSKKNNKVQAASL
jgi:hypothetical protein